MVEWLCCTPLVVVLCGYRILVGCVAAGFLSFRRSPFTSSYLPLTCFVSRFVVQSAVSRGILRADTVGKVA